MIVGKVQQYIERVIDSIPPDWLKLTTHRLDIYEEELAKKQFLHHFEELFKSSNSETSALSKLPTAYDYIRLGHPLSSILEWTIAQSYQINPQNVICFSSSTIVILAILRTNLLENIKTQIIYSDELPDHFDTEILRSIYGYQFELLHASNYKKDTAFDGSTILISKTGTNKTGGHSFLQLNLDQNIDFYINILGNRGSTVIVNGDQNASYISAIQHVRRRETIALTPNDCLTVLKEIVGISSIHHELKSNVRNNKNLVLSTIKEITGASTPAIIGSSGLSIQYAILMGLIHDVMEHHNGKAIKIIVPTNCYGGTNDQSRRIAAVNDQIDVMDLAVDEGHDMVQSIDKILDVLAKEDAIPIIIAEIPTSPRVEVPDLGRLRDVLSKKRATPNGTPAIEPIFILDQTFCPNVHYLGKDDILATVRTISYISGSKFPSGGLCTAGYCVANDKAAQYMERIEAHLRLCGNGATDLQIRILAEQMPSMNQRIKEAYNNTLEFTNFIHHVLPASKINFVDQDLASQGFTPSVFSLDLPTKGDSHEEREAHKRSLNHQLINMMITDIPDEGKHCVSYGQLKGSYWTIPATSTQGTTKESDKDYIVRVALSPDLDLERHKKVFSKFVESI